MLLYVKPVFIFVIFKMVIYAGWPSILKTIVCFILFLSCVIGMLGAAVETSIKRFLIFVSVYNMGYLSCFFWYPTSQMLGAFTVFYVIYAANSLAMMTLIGYFRHEEAAGDRFLTRDIRDLITMPIQNQPVAIIFSVILLTLSGFPPFSFFFIKYFFFTKFVTNFT